MRLKCNGQSIRSSEVVRRMIEARVVRFWLLMGGGGGETIDCGCRLQYLEKLRPLDQKLRYQIDKLIRLATTGSSGMGSGRDEWNALVMDFP